MREGHEALLALPLATFAFAFAFTLAGRGKGTLLADAVGDASGLVARRTVVSVSRIGMGLEELDLLAGLHCRSSLDLSKEASIRRLRYLHTSCLIEEITARLDDVLAEVLEQHSAQVFGGLLALLKQLLGSESIIRCSEAIESSVKKHLEYWGEVGVLLHQSLALLLLLTVVVGNVASQQLPGKSLAIRVTYTMMEYLVPARLR